MYQGYIIAHAPIFDLWLLFCNCSGDGQQITSPICSFTQCHLRVAFKSLTVSLFSIVKSL